MEIYFKTKEEPRKIRFDYDLFLHLDGSPPVNHLRCEKLTFQNPTEEFRRRLISAGGIGILGPNELGTTPVAVSSPSSNTSSRMTELFGPSLADSHSKKHKSTHSKSKKDKDPDDKERDDREIRKDADKAKSKSSSSKKSLPTSHGSQPRSVTPPSSQSTPKGCTPPSLSQQMSEKSSKEERLSKEATKRPSEESSSSEVQAKKKKKDKDKERERERERSKTSERSAEKSEKPRHDKEKDKSKSSTSTVLSSGSASQEKDTDKEKERKDRHRHKDSSSSSRSKSHKKSSHKERSKDRERSKGDSRGEKKSVSPSSVSAGHRSPVKGPSSPTKVKPTKDLSPVAIKRPKSMTSPGSPSLPPPQLRPKTQLPFSEILSTEETSDYDPFEDDPPDISKDVEPERSSKEAADRRKDMKSLFTSSESEDSDKDIEDIEDEDMSSQEAPIKASPHLQSSQTNLQSPRSRPSPALGNGHTASAETKTNSIALNLLAPDRSHSTHSQDKSSHKSHSSPQTWSPSSSSSSSRKSKTEKPPVKGRDSSKYKDNDATSDSHKQSTSRKKDSDSSKDYLAGSSSSRRRDTDIQKDRDSPWGSAQPSTTMARRMEPDSIKEKEPAAWGAPQSIVLAKSNKRSPPKLGMEPPDLLKSTQHGDFLQLQASQQNLPELEKENQGDIHMANGTNGSTCKTPLLENGPELPEPQLIPGYAPNGESFDLLLSIQEKLNSTRDESLLSQVVRALDECGEVFTLTDASLDFDLCYLKSKTVEKLRSCLQLS